MSEETYLDLRWVIDRSGKLITLKYWVGRSKKHKGYYAYSTEDSMNEYLAYLKSQADNRQRYIDSKKAEMDKISVGTILYYSWGYEQTNIDFFQVIERKRNSVVLREINKKVMVDGRADSMREKNRPLRDDFVGEPFTKRLGKYGIQMDHGTLELVEDGRLYASTSYG